MIAEFRGYTTSFIPPNEGETTEISFDGHNYTIEVTMDDGKVITTGNGMDSYGDFSTSSQKRLSSKLRYLVVIRIVVEFANEL